jgi:hypothetical protein
VAKAGAATQKKSELTITKMSIFRIRSGQRLRARIAKQISARAAESSAAYRKKQPRPRAGAVLVLLAIVVYGPCGRGSDGVTLPPGDALICGFDIFEAAGSDGVTLPPGDALICGFDICEAFGSDGVTLPPGDALICGFDMAAP